MKIHRKAPRPLAYRRDATPLRLWRLACALWDDGEHRRAFITMRFAALAGEISAQVNLGFLYDIGIGTKPNIAKALRWYRKAAHRGDAAAAHNLGVVFRGRKRYMLARRWFSLASNLGDVEACMELHGLA